jgi:lysophospholipase L1-like esterase
MAAPPSPEIRHATESRAPRPRWPWRKLAWALLATLLALGLAVELLSRRADTVVARRLADPAFDARAHTPDLWDKWSLGALDARTKLAEARVEPHPYLGYALKPDFHTPARAPLQASHNSYGLRGREIARAKPAGVTRIVTLGGSSVYGSQDSNDESVWSARLEKLLTAARPELRCEVVNGGCIGYSSHEMLVNYELRLADLAPDILVVYEAINDMRTALYTRGGVPVQPDNTHYRTAWTSARPGPLDAFAEHSRTYLLWKRYFTEQGRTQTDLYAFVQRNYGDPNAGPWYCDTTQWPDGVVPEQGFANYRRNLNSLVSIADAAGVRVVLATQALVRRHMANEFCRETQLAAFDRIQAIQREVAAERAIALCDCGPRIEAEVERVFQASPGHVHDGDSARAPAHRRCQLGADGAWRQDLLFHNDVHPYDAGSELVARTIAEWLLANLPP